MRRMLSKYGAQELQRAVKLVSVMVLSANE
jgi:hypothetical protein